MSWFFSSSASTPDASNIVHPPVKRFTPSTFFGPLVKEDTEWLCASGFATETQTFYATLPEGQLMMCQVIHSAVGLLWPQIQFTFRYFDPNTTPAKRVWKSVNVTKFVTPPPEAKGVKYDKRSCKADQFSIYVDPSKPDTYQIDGSYDKDVQINLTFKRPEGVPGWKLGAGPTGGMTYFGTSLPPDAGPSAGTKPYTAGGADGFVVHRFWPRCHIEGVATVEGQVIDLKGSRGVFVHAIQGMRPNLVASRWNFANFQSSKDDGVSLTMMEFTTTGQYGSQKVNVGSVVVDDRLVAVTGQTSDGTGSTATHLEPAVDAQTNYAVPGKISFEWTGSPLPATTSAAPASTSDVAKASILLDLQPANSGEERSSKGLIEKVDVLREIPTLVKKIVAMTGTSPFIYQWHNKVKASISIPASQGAQAKSTEMEGYLFNEATFISP